MVQLEVTLTGRSKSFTADTLQDCAKQFFDEFGEASTKGFDCSSKGRCPTVVAAPGIIGWNFQMTEQCFSNH